MQHTHITFYVGAAIKAYHVIWNNPTAGQILLCILETSPLLNDELITEYEELYNTQKHKCLDRDFGRTPRFWPMYVKLVERQKKTLLWNDFDLHLLIWKQSLLLCFATNSVHYSRYGSYYIKSLE